MEIKNMLLGLSQGEDRKKKYIIVALIILFLLSLVGTSVYFLTGTNGPATNDNEQLLSDLKKLAPRDGASTSTLKRLPLIELSSDRSAVAPGQPTKISWSASNATACVNGKGDDIALIGDLSVSPTELYTFDILCTGPYGIQSQSITIAVTSAPIIELIATPPAVLSGKQSYISWDTTNADRCEDSEGKTLRLSSGFTIKPTSDYTFKMSCIGEKGTTTKVITVKIASPVLVTNNSNVPTKTDTTTPTNTSPNSGSDTISWETDGTIPEAASTVSLTAVPQSIEYNKSVTINWSVKNVTYCVFTSDGTLGSLPPFVYTTGSRTIPKLSTTQKYTLTCTKGTDKVAKSVTITVGPAPLTPAPTITNFKMSNDFVATFGSLKATWATTNTKTCTLNRNSEVYKTSLPVNSSSYNIYENKAGVSTYTLTCTGASGTVTSEPLSVDVVNCSFKNGFGSEPDTVLNGTVIKDPNRGVICTYTYGDPKGSGRAFSNLWSFASEVIDDSRNTAQHLCQYTAYTTKTTSGGGVSHGFWRDSSYHGAWEYVRSVTETHGVSCGGSYSITWWNGSGFRSEGDSQGSYSCGNGTINVINSVTCWVK